MSVVPKTIAQLSLLSNSCSTAAALEKQIQHPRKHTPIKPPPNPDANGGGDGSVSSGACWVDVDADKWSWGEGSFTLDATAAAADLACDKDHYCWAIVGMKKDLTPQRFVEKCCPVASHGGVQSEIHKRSIEAREDVAIKTIVTKHIYDNKRGASVTSPSSPKKRPFRPEERGGGKKHRGNTDKDGPSQRYTMVEFFAGLCSFALAAMVGELPVQLSSFYEISPAAVGFSEHFFGIKTSGDVRAVPAVQFDIASVTMDCSPYSRAGLQRFRRDPKHQQAFWAADAISAAAPLVAVLEQVPDFYFKDDEHGIFTEMCNMMAEAVIPLPTLHLSDAQLGGWIHRERGITFMEAPSLRAVLPSWVVPIPEADPLRPGDLAWMQPTGDIMHTLRQGTFRLASPAVAKQSALASQVPVIVGWLQWGGPDTALQAGILISIWGAQWKVEDVSRHDSSKVRLIKEVGRFENKKHTECFMPTKDITSSMHEAKWYPVFSAYAPQRSPRRFFQQPEGCMNLVLDPRFSTHTVRVHSHIEVWQLIHSGLPEQIKQQQQESHKAAALTEKEMQQCAAGAVTFQMTTWIMNHLTARVSAYKEFLRFKWPDPLHTKHIDAAGMQANVKRVVLLMCTQHPAPAVLMSPGKAVLCHDIIDPSRAHVSAFEVCTSWAVALDIQVEPVLIGPVTLSTIDAAVLVFAVPIPSSNEALPSLLNKDIAEWVLVPRLSGMLRAVTDIAFAKLASFMGPSPSMSTLFDPQVKVGAVTAASVAVSNVAPQGVLVPFEYSVIKAVNATKHLRQAMLSSSAAQAIQDQVKDMRALCPSLCGCKGCSLFLC